MTADKRERIRQVLKDIASDAERDAAEFDGKPFNGRTVAEYLGNHGASIAALANVCQTLLDDAEAAVEAHCENRPHIYADGSTS